MALRKFEGMIAAGPPTQPASPSTYVWTPRTPDSPAVAKPEPTVSAPNAINLVKSIPDEPERPTTSKLRTEVCVIPQPASHKGKELAVPMAVIDTISTAESVKRDESILDSIG
jgi:hypothetical protein